MSDVLSIHERLQTDLPYFAKKAPLKIRTKAGELLPFTLNKAQAYIHGILEKQLKEKGRVRAIVLKARQEGCSTYVAARYYHKTTRQSNKSTFILSHESQTTDKLFRIVERFHEQCDVAIKPEIKTANRREFRFDGIDSEYSVGTAGNENVGRGGTIHFFHGSEVAFWENTDGIATGIMQCVPDMDGTEIILESTANGMGNMFYDKCAQAMKGEGDYELIFIPWFWMDEYRKRLPDDFIITPEEEEYAKSYGLSDEQVYWRRCKIADFKSEWKFKQEYPANPIEAFQTSGASLIRSEAIMNARRNPTGDVKAPLVISLDPGRTRDRSVFAWRRGRELLKVEVYTDRNEMQLVGLAAHFLDRDRPAKMFIDVGHSNAIVDRLYEHGYRRTVQGVFASEGAIDSDIYHNKRAEMWCMCRDWLHNGGVKIPDDDAIHADLSAMPDFKQTSSGKIVLESNEKIRKDFGQSLDIGSAIVLTFAYPVSLVDNGGVSFRKKFSGKSQLKTLSRIRGQEKTREVETNLSEDDNGSNRITFRRR